MIQSIQSIIRSNPLLRVIGSLKVTVSCLFALFVLTFWGTVAQKEIGLYLAQHRFFYSWWFWVDGPVPFPVPGARLWMWVLFLNLCVGLCNRFVLRWKHLGLWITHLGLLSYFVAAFLTFHQTVESQVTLGEGEGTNLSQSYHVWELSIWDPRETAEREVTAVDFENFFGETLIDVDPLGLRLKSRDAYRNASAFTTESPVPSRFANASGIVRLAQRPLENEHEQNLPGLLLSVSAMDGPDSQKELILFGGEQEATRLEIGEHEWAFQLRRKRYELPFHIRLNRFEREVYPGTEIPRSFQSFVSLRHENHERPERVYMNHPLRFQDYTLYQASYAVDASGRELSTLAVVKNPARNWPYVSSLITFVGLLIHVGGFMIPRAMK